jgi:hypothetical protein
VIVGAAYALGAAATTPFTTAADLMTGLPIVALAVVVVACWPLHPRPVRLSVPGTGAGHPYRPWAVLGLVILGWELAEYLIRGSRGAHPTLSSMADAVDRSYPLKALMFFGWLCLGAAIVVRGRAGDPAAPAAPPPATPATPAAPAAPEDRP